MGNKLILIVDDEEDFLGLISKRIIDWGYDILTALNGEAGIEALKNKNPDIVILDYMMPDMDGVSVLKEIRKIKKDIPVIMFTAYPDTRAMKDSGRLGISAFIPKLSVYPDVLTSLKAAIAMIEKKLNKKGA